MGKRTNTAVWSDKHGRWQINVQKDGKRRSFYSSTPGRNGQREANKKADVWLDDNIVSDQLKVRILFQDYLNGVKETTSRSNYEQIVYFGKNWILPEIGEMKISRITEQHLQNILNHAYSKHLSKKTIMGIRATIAAFFKYCRKCKATMLFPENLTIPKGAVTGEKRILQPNDLATLFSDDTTIMYGKVCSDYLINAYRFQVLTGLRPGELLALEWRDIQGNQIKIQRSINKYGEITPGKNTNAKRVFLLTNLAYSVLQDQKQVSTTQKIFGDVSQELYAKRWKRYCDYHKITPVTPYELRHTFVSIAKTLPEGQVKSLVGHSKNMDTFGTYGHIFADELAQTAKDLDGVFSNILSSEEGKK